MLHWSLQKLNMIIYDIIVTVLYIGISNCVGALRHTANRFHYFIIMVIITFVVGYIISSSWSSSHSLSVSLFSLRWHFRPITFTIGNNITYPAEMSHLPDHQRCPSGGHGWWWVFRTWFSPCASVPASWLRWTRWVCQGTCRWSLAWSSCRCEPAAERPRCLASRSSEGRVDRPAVVHCNINKLVNK